MSDVIGDINTIDTNDIEEVMGLIATLVLAKKNKEITKDQILEMMNKDFTKEMSHTCGMLVLNENINEIELDFLEWLRDEE